jgi:hypothetical protein
VKVVAKVLTLIAAWLTAVWAMAMVVLFMRQLAAAHSEYGDGRLGGVIAIAMMGAISFALFRRALRKPPSGPPYV